MKMKMKITIAAILLTIISLNVSAQAKIEVQKVNLPASFQTIEVEGEVRVLLTNETPDELIYKGNRKDVSRIRSIVKDGKLIIDATAKRTFDELVIYVPVGSAKSLVVKGNAQVYSAETIRTNALEIVLKGETYLKVAHRGPVKVKAGDGYDLVTEWSY